MLEDYYFYRACQDARDDAYYGIFRTQTEVLNEAERYRRMKIERVGH